MSPRMMLVWLWVSSALLMTGGWRWQLRRTNAGIVDVIWAAGLAGAALGLAVGGSGAILPRALLGVLGFLWAARLASHLWRRISVEPEDGRYRYLRSHWHGSQLKFFAFFQLQALLIVLFSLAFLAVAQNPRQQFTVWTGLGAAIWTVSVLGEWLADRQLAGFRAARANQGRTCRVGLWRYSRHPNYFFEWLHWWTYVALAVGSRWAWLSYVGPALMYVFLRWLSGVPFTEAQALRTRGEDYRRYQQETPMFFPWFPQPLARVRASEEPR
jgi:steroid 5-alpha reductase family enzyme